MSTKRGRSRKDDRDIRVEVRLNEHENELLTTLREEKGWSISEIMRRSLVTFYYTQLREDVFMWPKIEI